MKSKGTTDTPSTRTGLRNAPKLLAGVATLGVAGIGVMTFPFTQMSSAQPARTSTTHTAAKVAQTPHHTNIVSPSTVRGTMPTTAPAWTPPAPAPAAAVNPMTTAPAWTPPASTAWPTPATQ